MSAENTTPPPNAAQIEYWNKGGGAAWSNYHDLLDRQLGPLGHEAMRVLDLKAGEAVLDIGCGCGQTTFELATRVGPTGSVTGVDISAPMLAIAEARAPHDGAGEIEFRLRDVQTDDLGIGRYDVAFSRFGVMFFSEPTVAFRNIHRALRPDGRLAFVCWQPFSSNPWMREPLEAVRHLLPPSEPPDPLAPGPFAFADPDRVRGILTDAGFTNIDIASFETTLGSGSVDETLAVTLRIGPLGRAVADQPERLPELAGPVRAVLERYLTSNGVQIPASAWIVRALGRQE
ncbi:class I SAM-dependent methyltransferase [Fimbriimonas ginsengisoli]|uniref:Type 11 methyltransferase n=1 Tax=Fimbriimonas ginsengisoli Gsoil 348 TaxID=661478 RepID=A0A068NPC1_FIMGI|nr:class I SAM-dependent methyltransferase [Fimbriimonas ginsengisoli]AIE84560.1 type 11 methyltransferase [Fimbriimonas ginsengisoli Gsoil 348]